MSAAGDMAALQAALAAVQARVAAAAGQPAPKTAKTPARSSARLETLAASLSPFERDVILLAALPALEPGAGALIAKAQGEARLRLPTVAFALSVLEAGHWSAFASDGPLRGGGLIELTDEPVASARGLILPERVLHHLVGLDGIDAALFASARPLAPRTALAKTHAEFAKEIAARLGPARTDAPIIQILGSDRALSIGLAAAVGAAAGRTTHLLDSESLPSSPAERARIARLWSREARLSGALPVIDAHDASTPAELRAAARLAEAIAGPVVILASEPTPVAHRATEKHEAPRSTAKEQAALWTRALGPLARKSDGAPARLASHFTASPEVIDTVAALAKEAAEKNAEKARAARKTKKKDPEPPLDLGALLWTETRARTRPRLDELASRLDIAAGWDDLILPARQKDTLRAVAAQVRQRARVYEQWGFGGHGGRGLGISALFAGPSGTGKTLAAEVIGAALGLDVYRIDLSAVVSKWIGETEKNLRRVFDAAEDTSAILLFDEADALFGKRSEVRESHDRYANIEVSYLLQRMETYRGLAILTTNLRSHLDTAFLRRIRFMVDFPFPAEVERRAIWQLAFPKDAPRNGIDEARLAQLNVPGGSIRNIALNAAFIAADCGAPIGMAHVRAAARAEYDKLGKTLTDGELRGWVLGGAS